VVAEVTVLVPPTLRENVLAQTAYELPLSEHDWVTPAAAPPVEEVYENMKWVGPSVAEN